MTLQAAHARLAHRGLWALNEKRMVQWAGLTGLYERFATLGTTKRALHHAIDTVAAAVEDVRVETGG